jgi:hypothetical protein
MNDTEIIADLNALIKKGRTIAFNLYTRSERISYASRTNEDKKGPARNWECYVCNLLKLRFGEKSDFYTEFEKALSSKINGEEYYQENIMLAVSVLEFIKDSLEKGLTDDLFYQREMILFGDMLKQAEEFLKQKQPIAAAIYGRIILELTVIEYGTKHGITNRMKFDQLIINLRQNGTIHEPLEVSLRANYKIGSLAAHGDPEFSKLSESEIREFLAFIRDKVLTLN